MELRCSCFSLATNQTSSQREGQTEHNMLQETNKNDRKEQIHSLVKYIYNPSDNKRKTVIQ